MHAVHFLQFFQRIIIRNREDFTMTYTSMHVHQAINPNNARPQASSQENICLSRLGCNNALITKLVIKLISYAVSESTSWL